MRRSGSSTGALSSPLAAPPTARSSRAFRAASSGFDTINHPYFTPPAVSPETMRRWKTSTITTSGTVTSAPAAIVAAYGNS